MLEDWFGFEVEYDVDAFELFKDRFEQLGEMLHVASIHYQNKSGPECFRGIIGVGTEFVISGKACSVLARSAGHLYTRAAQQIKTAIEGANKERALEHVLVTAEGIEARIAAESHGLFNKSVESVGEKVGGVVGESLPAGGLTLESACSQVMEEVKKGIELLRPVFENTRKGFGVFADKFIKIDYKHILGIELKFGRNGLSKISGFHHDFMNSIEKSGLLDFRNKIMCQNGFYKAKIFSEGRFIKEISFFPTHWSREKVVSAIYEAYDEFVKSGRIAELGSDGKYFFDGFTKDGVKIEMYMTQNCKITTAYPLLN
jgi:hypothetical protein